MIDEKIAGLICSVAGKFDSTGRHYMAACYWFRSKDANGFELFAENEAKERWHYSGKLYRYVSDRGFQPIIQAAPAIQSNGWAGVDSVVGVLKKHDESTCIVIDGMVKQLISQGVGAAGVFLAGVQNHFQDDIREIRAVDDHVQTKNTMLEMVNERLYRDYSKK